MSALRRQPAAAPVTLEARVSNPDPDALTVTIDQFDGEQLTRHAWEVASWPRGSFRTPARGDRCLVAMSEIGRVWVVAGDWSGTPEWRRLEWAAAWADWNPATHPTGYAKAPNGWVSLRGLLRFVGTAAMPQPANAQYTQMLVAGRELPPDCRPAMPRSFLISVQGQAGRVQVHADGRLLCGEVPSNPAAGAFWSLDGIGYWAER